MHKKRFVGKVALSLVVAGTFAYAEGFIDRAVLSVGGGQTSVAGKSNGCATMGITLSKNIGNSVYLGAGIDGVAFHGSNESVDLKTQFDTVMNVYPMVGYGITDSLILQGKVAKTFGTLGGSSSTVGGVSYGGALEFDITKTLTLGVSYMTGDLTIDVVGGSSKETVKQTVGYVGFKY